MNGQLSPFDFPQIYALNKPAGMSSTKMLSQFKRKLPKKTKKIGHFGTLDPFASGLLLVGFGGAMKLMNSIQNDLPKAYEALGLLGTFSETGDLTASDDQVYTDPNFEPLKIQKNFDCLDLPAKFIGPYWQSPPAYSATKHQGRSLYDWARKEGKLIKKEPVQRYIYELSVEKLSENELYIKTLVSSGTYIRVLFDDLAKRLQTRGVLKTLKRVSIGPIHLEHSISAEMLEEQSIEELKSFSINPCEVLKYPKIFLNSQQAADFANGRVFLVEKTQLKENIKDSYSGPFWLEYGIEKSSVNDSKSLLLGLGRLEGQYLKSEVVFSSAQSFLLNA